MPEKYTIIDKTQLALISTTCINNKYYLNNLHIHNSFQITNILATTVLINKLVQQKSSDAI